MLSPLQEQVAKIIAGLEEATDFALAGGAALISRGDVERQTKDLDFFGLTTEAVDRLLPAVERAFGGPTAFAARKRPIRDVDDHEAPPTARSTCRASLRGLAGPVVDEVPPADAARGAAAAFVGAS